MLVMRQISLSIALFLGICLGVIPYSVQAQQRNLSGTWDLKMNAGGHHIAYTLCLEQQGKTLSGTLVKERLPVNGTLAEEAVTFRYVVEEEDGTLLTVVYKGAVAATSDAMEGTVHVERQNGAQIGSTRTWSAHRQISE